MEEGRKEEGEANIDEEPTREELVTILRMLTRRLRGETDATEQANNAEEPRQEPYIMALRALRSIQRVQDNATEMVQMNDSEGVVEQETERNVDEIGNSFRSSESGGGMTETVREAVRPREPAANGGPIRFVGGAGVRGRDFWRGTLGRIMGLRPGRGGNAGGGWEGFRTMRGGLGMPVTHWFRGGSGGRVGGGHVVGMRGGAQGSIATGPMGGFRRGRGSGHPVSMGGHGALRGEMGGLGGFGAVEHGSGMTEQGGIRVGGSMAREHGGMFGANGDITGGMVGAQGGIATGLTGGYFPRGRGSGHYLWGGHGVQGALGEEFGGLGGFGRVEPDGGLTEQGGIGGNTAGEHGGMGCSMMQGGSEGGMLGSHGGRVGIQGGITGGMMGLSGCQIGSQGGYFRGSNPQTHIVRIFREPCYFSEIPLRCSHSNRRGRNRRRRRCCCCCCCCRNMELQ